MYTQLTLWLHFHWLLFSKNDTGTHPGSQWSIQAWGKMSTCTIKLKIIYQIKRVVLRWIRRFTADIRWTDIGFSLSVFAAERDLKWHSWRLIHMKQYVWLLQILSAAVFLCTRTPCRRQRSMLTACIPVYCHMNVYVCMCINHLLKSPHAEVSSCRSREFINSCIFL